VSERRLPAFAGGLRYGHESRSPRELFAGVTLAALALPLNIGYATAAGLPATVGIYATLVPLVVFALVTGSRHLIVGADATIAALLAAALAPIVAAGADPAELASATALCVGLTLLVFWALRLGSLVRFVSKAVLVGFIAGLGIEVLTSQVRKMMAVSVEAERWPSEVVELVRSIPEASAASVAVGLGTIVGLRVLRRVAPRIPGALVVLTAATVLVAVLEPAGVAVLGDVPSGLPTPTVPTLGLDIWLDLVAVAVAIAVLSTAEGALLAQRYARRDGEHVDANGEVFALGSANVAAAMSGAMPVGPSASRTAAVASAGACTQVPSLIAAAVVAMVLLFFTDAVARLPEAALAGLVASAVVSTIEVAELRRFGRLRRSELGIALGCTAGVLLIGPIGGIVLAVLVSAVDVVRRAAAAPWAELDAGGADDPLGRMRAARPTGSRAGRLMMVRPSGPLFFANADMARTVLEDAAADPDVSWVVIDLETVGDVDPTAAEALEEGIGAALAGGTVVALSRVTRPVRELLDRYGIIDMVGSEHIYDSNRRARAVYESERDQDQ
jgi:sulfate permease, SulP family